MSHREDKIFNNKFHESEYDGRSINWEAEHKSDVHDDLDSMMLEEKIHELIMDSEFKYLNELDENMKAPTMSKDVLRDVYIYLSKEIKTHSRVDLFHMFTYYFDITEHKLYNALTNRHRNELHEELNVKLDINDKKNINKLY